MQLGLPSTNDKLINSTYLSQSSQLLDVIVAMSHLDPRGRPKIVLKCIVNPWGFATPISRGTTKSWGAPRSGNSWTSRHHILKLLKENYFSVSLYIKIHCHYELIKYGESKHEGAINT